MGTIRKSKITKREEEKELEDAKIAKRKELTTTMGQLSTSMGQIAALAPTGSYAQGILSGAASGAAAGTSINPGWGTLIGGIVGAGAGLGMTAAGKKKAKENNSDEMRTQTLKNLGLQYDVLKQQYRENQRDLNWDTNLRNSFKYS